MKTYQFYWKGGYPLIDLDGIPHLIDTGSPSSWSEAGGIYGDIQTPMPDSLADPIHDQVDPAVQGLIGMDQLRRQDMFIDVSAGNLHFGTPSRHKGTDIEMGFLLGICPTIQAQIDDHKVNFIFDTGAPLGYIDQAVIGQTPSQGEREDFWPLEGEGVFQVPVYSKTVSTVGGSYQALFAPRRQLMDMLGISVLGNGLLHNYAAEFLWDKGTLRLHSSTTGQGHDSRGNSPRWTAPDKKAKEYFYE